MGVSGKGWADIWVYQAESHQARGRQLPVIAGSTMRIEKLGANASYTVEFWDTEKGQPTDKTTVSADAAGAAQVPLPPVPGDLAIKLRSVGR
jgi:hypothetical protein